MSSFEITGSRKLRGEIIPQGAKNEALQVICACLLTDEKITIHNIPEIRDVNNLIDLLETLGVKVSRSGGSPVVSRRLTPTSIFSLRRISVQKPEH